MGPSLICKPQLSANYVCCRYLLPGEYTQMAGRAGRRGLDTVGNVIVAAWEDIPGVVLAALTLWAMSSWLHGRTFQVGCLRF